MKRQRQTPEHLKGVDRDHLLFYDREWSASSYSRALRTNPMLIVPLDREVHEAKHDAVSFVPPLGRFVAALVVRDYKAVQGDYLASLDGLIDVIDDQTHDRRLPLDERRYAEFTIDALARSRPFVERGLVLPADRHLRAV